MANKITESAEINPQNTDWQNLISKTIQLGGGYNFAQFSAMDTDAAPQVLAGSRFEINGSFYQCVSNESITGTPAANVVNYVYAIPNGSSCSFQYSATAPTFQPQKGGWYNGNNRALLKFTYTNSAYRNKEMMRDFSVMYDRQVIEGRLGEIDTRVNAIRFTENSSINFPSNFDLKLNLVTTILNGVSKTLAYSVSCISCGGSCSGSCSAACSDGCGSGCGTGGCSP